MTFYQTMLERIRSIEERAKAAGSNMTQVCKSTGVARVTYERWKQRAPKTIALLDQLDAEVGRLERERASQPASEGAAA